MISLKVVSFPETLPQPGQLLLKGLSMELSATHFYSSTNNSLSMVIVVW